VFVIVAYDVNTQSPKGRRRLRRVARQCENYGTRVQKSVFECVLRDQDWVRLRSGLLSEYSEREDSLRFYFLDETARRKTEHHGCMVPIDVEGTLIV
jgi:CRISPR-associated protein Cas2